MAMQAAQRAFGSTQPGDILVVIHDFDARSADELTLRKSERVELIELDDGFGDGWYLGKHLTRGGTGLFPGVYTTKAASTVRAPGHGTQPFFNGPPAYAPGAHGATTMHRSSNSITSQQIPGPYQHTSSPVDMIAQDSPPDTPSEAYVSTAPVHNNFIPGVRRSIGQTMGQDPDGEESPVMNETLSVIDEHITDLSTPRQSLAAIQSVPEDSESDYSSHLDRHSYVVGPETDEEDHNAYSEIEVRQWDHLQTTEHLRAIGVDSKHCQIFEEQEISGDVLLDMDQSFVYMKEYDFGVMGRRLRTWHKIRDFQTSVKGIKRSRQNTVSSLGQNSSLEEINRAPSRSLTGPPILPRIPSLRESPGLSIRQSPQGMRPQQDEENDIPLPLQTQSGMARASLPESTPPSAWRNSIAPESPSRRSAPVSHELDAASRRHSSIDFGRVPNLELASLASTASHNKKPSLDRDWSMNAGTSTTTTAASSLKPEVGQDLESTKTDSPFLSVSSNLDLDRGYFSGNEVENRKTRNHLRKRESTGSTMHSRQSSYLEDSRKNPTTVKRHSRLSSVDSIRPGGPQMTSPASKAYHSGSHKSRLLSPNVPGSSPKTIAGAISPTVTNLEGGFSPSHVRSASGTTPSPNLHKLSVQDRARKALGLRVASEAVTDGEKQAVTKSSTVAGDNIKASPMASRSGSITPSAPSHSLEIEPTDTSSKGGTTTALSPLPKGTSRPRPKTKQHTSAYTRGLLNITPAEARNQCDYHGWMKKKSSSLMTTWKPRLFILRGRRLSYYYSETDTVERGIIDISGHKVLVANSEPMTTLHASITGASSTPSPKFTSTSTDTSPVMMRSPQVASGAPFFFKLVPPKSGISRAVQFTKPTIHYFQVDNVIEGRKWMGEIMKATIEHDLTTFETTNKQKTISLAKARARKERPPALKDVEGDIDPVAEKENVRESGLNIQGLDFDNPNLSLDLMADTVKEKDTKSNDVNELPATSHVSTS